jgi:hypothetical protein
MKRSSQAAPTTPTQQMGLFQQPASKKEPFHTIAEGPKGGVFLRFSTSALRRSRLHTHYRLDGMSKLRAPHFFPRATGLGIGVEKIACRCVRVPLDANHQSPKKEPFHTIAEGPKGGVFLRFSTSALRRSRLHRYYRLGRGPKLRPPHFLKGDVSTSITN